MKISRKISIILFIATVIMALCVIFDIEALYCFFGAIDCGIMAIVMFIVSFSDGTGTKPYKIFFWADLVALCISSGYFIYSMIEANRSSGLFAGLLGLLVGMFVCIPLAVFLLIDIVLYFINKRKAV